MTDDHEKPSIHQELMEDYPECRRSFSDVEILGGDETLDLEMDWIRVGNLVYGIGFDCPTSVPLWLGLETAMTLKSRYKL